MPRPNRGRRIGAEDDLARRIVYERALRGWSYQTLADAMAEVGCPISPSALFRIEHGKPDGDQRTRRKVTVDELVALSRVFDTPVADLLLPPEGARNRFVIEVHERAARVARRVADDVAELWALLGGARGEAGSDPQMVELLNDRDAEMVDAAVAGLFARNGMEDDIDDDTAHGIENLLRWTLQLIAEAAVPGRETSPLDLTGTPTRAEAPRG